MKPSRHVDENMLEAYRQKPCAACYPNWMRPDFQEIQNPAGLHISDPSHIRSRGAGGGDEVWNILPLCREHHSEWHKVGVQTFLKNHPSAWHSMQRMGWRFVGKGLYHEKEKR